MCPRQDAAMDGGGYGCLSTIACGRGEIDRPARNDGGDGVLVDHLGHRVAQQHHILVKRFDLALELDSIHKIDCNGNVFFAQRVEEGILEKLAFVGHDMFRVVGGKQG